MHLAMPDLHRSLHFNHAMKTQKLFLFAILILSLFAGQIFAQTVVPEGKTAAGAVTTTATSALEPIETRILKETMKLMGDAKTILTKRFDGDTSVTNAELIKAVRTLRSCLAKARTQKPKKA